jgi:hypothetical protein
VANGSKKDASMPENKSDKGGQKVVPFRKVSYSIKATPLHSLTVVSGHCRSPRLLCRARNDWDVWCSLFVLIRHGYIFGDFFLIVGGFYSEVALQKREAEGTVHPRRRRRRFLLIGRKGWTCKAGQQGRYTLFIGIKYAV